MASIKSVWIEDGCIPACSCAIICPQVFRFPTEEEYKSENYSSKVIGSARVDGSDSQNDMERSELIGNVGIVCFDKILEAADACPVNVIKFNMA